MALLKPTHAQPCAYCYQDFIPTRRGTQRFCSGGCRTTYSRKLKAGTLGQLTQLPTPAAVRGQGRKAFKETFLAAGAGALGANVITQGVEYLAVLRPMEQRLERLETMAEQILRNQAQIFQSQAQEKVGLLALLTKAGIAPNVARAGLGMPLMPEIQPVQASQASKVPRLRKLV